MTILYRHQYLASAPQHQLLVDDQGNVPAVQIRGTAIVLGDGASATSPTAIVIGTNSTVTGTQGIVVGFSSTGAGSSLVFGNGSSAVAGGGVFGGGITNTAGGSLQLGVGGNAFIKASSSSRQFRAFGGFSQTNTPSAAAVLAGCVEITAQATLPTAAQLVAAIPDAVAADVASCLFVNNSAGDLDFRGGAPAGITFVDASSTITARTSRLAYFFVTNATLGAEAVSVF